MIAKLNAGSEAKYVAVKYKTLLEPCICCHLPNAWQSSVNSFPFLPTSNCAGILNHFKYLCWYSLVFKTKLACFLV